MAILFFAGRYRATDQANEPIPGAFLSFYAVSTSTFQPVYADPALSASLTNPVKADANGLFPEIWGDDSLPAYKIIHASPDINDPTQPGSVIWTIAQYNATVSAAGLGKILNPLSGAETLMGASVANFTYLEGDIRRYGAVSLADTPSQLLNSTAIQTALNVSGAGGRPAYIPGGTWSYSIAPVAPSGSSMYGDGQISVLNPNACDGLQFGAQSGILKSRSFRDFMLNGTNTGPLRDGIVINLSAVSGTLVTGVIFSNLTIQGFNTGVFCRGLWQSAFEDCFLYNNYQGYYFHGQSIKVTILGGFIQKGTIAGSGQQIGVNVDSVASETCQSLHLIAASIYGYDIGFSAGPALYTQLDGCDIDVATTIGINLAAVSGGTYIRDTWVQTHGPDSSTPTIGINLSDLGAAVTDKVVIDGVTLVSDVAATGSKGVYVGTNQQGAVICNSTIGTQNSPFDIGIASNGVCHNLKSDKNTINATTTAHSLSSNATDCCVHDATILSGALLVFSGLTPAGFSLRARGSYTMTLTGMTATTTVTVTYTANGRTITLSVPTAGITGTSNATTMTGTGLPQWLWPSADRNALFATIDNNIAAAGAGTIASASGTVTFFKTLSGTAFTNTGTKGLAGLDSSYAY